MAKKPDSFYFDNYVACADLAVQAAELLTQIFENFDPAQIHDMLNKMHAIEHAADKKHHELEDALLTAFITPLEREDLDLMSCSLDTVLDRIEGVVQRVYFTNIQSIHPDAIVIAHKVTDACRAMKDLMVELPNYRKSKTLRELVIQIRKLLLLDLLNGALEYCRLASQLRSTPSSPKPTSSISTPCATCTLTARTRSRSSPGVTYTPSWSTALTAVRMWPMLWIRLS